MFTRLLTIWDRIRSSLWALPLVMVCAACALAYMALNAGLEVGENPAWFLYSGNAEQAPQFLSNLVSAMITMATLAISITMVVLTLAAQQLGPRLIRSFISDRRTQISLGLFIATVVYLLLVLRSTYGPSDVVDNLAVTVGTALVLVSIGSLLFFVHHLAQSIIADNVIARIGSQLDANIDRLLPEEQPEQPDLPKGTGPQGSPALFAYGGYVQAIALDDIVKAAAEEEAFVELTCRAGQYAVPGRILGYITPAAACERLSPAVENAVFVGRERTSVQDLEFSVHQLVEIALRALSPGINDPFTAIAALDRLTLSLSIVMQRAEAKSIWADENGVPRVVVPVSTFEGVTDAAFNQIRQRAEGMPDVLIRMAEDIGLLLQQAGGSRHATLEKHLTLVLRAGRRSIREEEDLKDLERTVDEARKAAETASA